MTKIQSLNTELLLFTFLLTFLLAQLVKNPPATQEILVRFLGQEDHLRKGYAIHSGFLGILLWLSWQIICLQCGRPGFGRSPGERNSYPLQYTGVENSRDCIVHGVAKSQT